jgi:formate dehydrogenase-N beta subunit
MESQDIIKRSATNDLTPPPQARNYKQEVAKLIDVSTCIGCKGCQVACAEWSPACRKISGWKGTARC